MKAVTDNEKLIEWMITCPWKFGETKPTIAGDKRLFVTCIEAGDPDFGFHVDVAHRYTDIWHIYAQDQEEDVLNTWFEGQFQARVLLKLLPVLLEGLQDTDS